MTLTLTLLLSTKKCTKKINVTTATPSHPLHLQVLDSLSSLLTKAAMSSGAAHWHKELAGDTLLSCRQSSKAVQAVCASIRNDFSVLEQHQKSKAPN